MHGNLFYPELSYLIYGLCFKVHNKLGRYCNEKQYADALEEISKTNKIKYLREEPIAVSFQGEHTRRNIPDFLIEDLIILDLKAKRVIEKDDYFQMKRYLVAGSKKLGIIVNFRQKFLTPKRILNSSV